MNEILRCWINRVSNDRGQPLDLVNITMKFDKDTIGPRMTEMIIPKSREEKDVLEKSINFGLIDIDSLIMLRDAINQFIIKEYMDEKRKNHE